MLFDVLLFADLRPLPPFAEVLVGDLVGGTVELSVGASVDVLVGDPVGGSVGLLVGETVKVLVGDPVGGLIGLLVGNFDWVGSPVGESVGLFVGEFDEVGDPVGDSDVVGLTVLQFSWINVSLAFMHSFGVLQQSSIPDGISLLLALPAS